MHVVTACLLGGILWFMFTRCTKVQRDQMFVVLAFIVFCLMFFTLYEQTYGSWVLFSDRVMNHGALGVEWTASELTSLGAFFILVLAPFFAWLYPRLDRARLQPEQAREIRLRADPRRRRRSSCWSGARAIPRRTD